MRTVRTMELGDGFGDLALQVAGGVRAATVRASEWSQFLIINGFAYRKILSKYHREDIDSRVRHLPGARAWITSIYLSNDVLWHPSKQGFQGVHASSQCSADSRDLVIT
jgi:hypothetical protein